MNETAIRNDPGYVYCSRDTRKRLRSLKRGGETFDELLRRMADQYEPAAEQRAEGTDDDV